LPPASQERGIRPNLATLGASLRDASIGECTLNDSNGRTAPLTTTFLYRENEKKEIFEALEKEKAIIILEYHINAAMP
jgi:hypothetical protein